MQIDLKKLDEAQLTQVGLSKEKLLQLPSDTLELLSKGEKSPLLAINLDNTPINKEYCAKENIEYTEHEGKLKTEGKLKIEEQAKVKDTPLHRSLLSNKGVEFTPENGNELNIKGTINLRKVAIGLMAIINPTTLLVLLLIPKRKEMNVNNNQFSKENLSALKGGNVINLKDTLYQRDAETNEIVSIPSKLIKIPDQISSVELTIMEKEKLKQGLAIQLTNGTVCQLDLNSSSGIKIDLTGQQLSNTIGPGTNTIDPGQQLSNTKLIGSDGEIKKETNTISDSFQKQDIPDAIRNEQSTLQKQDNPKKATTEQSIKPKTKRKM